MTVAAQPATDAEVFAWELLARAAGIETWRRTLALVLRAWGASDATIEVARMGLSELLSNIVRHVDDPCCRLSAALEGRRVVVRVSDRSSVVPRVCEPGWDAESGRGLWLLRAMCREFGCEPEVGGKAVWFVLDLDGAGAS